MSTQLSSTHRNSTSTPARKRPPYPGARPGRPIKLTEGLIRRIMEMIRNFGVSDTEAGLTQGVPSSSMERWKKIWPQFRDDLKAARANFWIDRIIKIMEARKKDGSIDWRAEAWLYEHAQVDENGERLQRGLGRMPASVRRVLAEVGGSDGGTGRGGEGEKRGGGDKDIEFEAVTDEGVEEEPVEEYEDEPEEEFLTEEEIAVQRAELDRIDAEIAQFHAQEAEKARQRRAEEMAWKSGIDLPSTSQQQGAAATECEGTAKEKGTRNA